MHSVSFLDGPATSDPELSASDPSESSGLAAPSPAPIHNSIFREPDGRLNRPLIAVLTVAALLALGHFVFPAQSGAPMWVNDVAKMAQVILSPQSPGQEMPRAIAPPAPTSNPEHELRGSPA